MMCLFQRLQRLRGGRPIPSTTCRNACILRQMHDLMNIGPIMEGVHKNLMKKIYIDGEKLEGIS